MKTSFQNFFGQDSATGILLFIMAVLALFAANSIFAEYYMHLIETPFKIQLGDFKLSKPLLLWVNDGLMAIFFFLVGLELKREFYEGELSEVKKVILPAMGALGGMLVPALIYVALNWGGEGLHGWAIPAATDIAFALGVLALLGSRIPRSLKVLLTSIAIFDDIGAIIIIAVFYTSSLSFLALGIAACCVVVLAILHKMNVAHKTVYMLVGLVMWTALLKSGVHATLAGIVLAFFIPMKDPQRPHTSPLKTLEHDLHVSVSFIILPIFAFFNAGVALAGMGVDQFTHSVPLGVALGLFIGKQIGVFAFCWLGIKLKIAKMPRGSNWLYLYGIGTLCGIGFTMSLFIGSLAFDDSVNGLFDERLGILLGSLLSGIWGYAVLRYASKRQADKEALDAKK